MAERKHADMIKAWADGYEIEAFNPEHQAWVETPTPGWFEDIEYRIKPHTMQPSKFIIRYAHVGINPFTNEVGLSEDHGPANVKMIFQEDDLIEITHDHY